MIKHVTVAIASLTAPIAVLSGCSNTSSDNESTSSSSTTSSTAAAGAQQLTTQMKTADGKTVADATIDFSNDSATVTVQTVTAGILSPGFHGLHIHAYGRCEANSTGPNNGPAGDFNSAGDHFQAPGHTGQPASGDLPPLLVGSDGSGKLVVATDAFTADQLKGPDGSAIVVHEGADLPGGTGDPEKRVACGVLSPATAAASTSTSTSTVTTTTVSTAPATTVTETQPVPPPSSSVSPSTGVPTTPMTETPTPTTVAPTSTTAVPTP